MPGRKTNCVASGGGLVQNVGPTMKMKLLATALLLASCLTGWAWPRSSITQEKVNQIRLGQTTEADLVQLFGAPTTRMTDLRHQVELDWFRSAPMPVQGYLPFIGSFIGGLDLDSQQLYVVLAPNGRVLRFYVYSTMDKLRGPMQQASVRHVAYAK